jgi:single-stranded-DNA-specific exonuclease
MHRRWFIRRTNPEYLTYLSKAASIPPVLAQILINRGIKTASDVHSFLNPGITSLSDPYDLPGMGIAVERIKAALARNQRVLVHGDYDADGLTATAIMVLALKKIGADVGYFIPNRLAHGYGFNPHAVDFAENFGADLIITVDCGTTSFDAAACAKGKGIDVIITDHHEPVRQSTIKGHQPEEKSGLLLPDALAVINPKLSGPGTQTSALSGSGIAFKTVQALSMDRDVPLSSDDALSFLDLAACGTIADVVALTGENRVLVKEGLPYIANPHRRGISALKEVSGLQGREVKAGLLAFTIVPRMNAAGRMGDAGEVIRLLFSSTDEEALAIAGELDRVNTERQQRDEEVYQEAVYQLHQKGYDKAIVLYGKDWHPGVLGIVASRIAEECYRPAFIFSLEGDNARGSARSIPCFDLYGGLTTCRDILIAFGGHAQAAGLRLHIRDLPLFEERMNSIVRDSVKDEDLIPALEIDAEVGLSGVTGSLIRDLSMLEPLGCGNPEPLLGSRNLEVLNPRVVGNNHMKMRLRQGAFSIDAVGFDMGRLVGSIDPLSPVDAAFTPTINIWNGGRYLQLGLKALRPGR